MAFEIGKIQTIVGTGKEGYAGDGGPATQALIGEAYGCDFDTEGNLYIVGERERRWLNACLGSRCLPCILPHGQGVVVLVVAPADGHHESLVIASVRGRD